MSVVFFSGPTAGIKEGQTVKRTHRIASILVNDNMLGRVINPLGEAIDGNGDIDLTGAFEMPLDRKDARRYLSSTGERTITDRPESCRFNDSYR